MWVHYDLTDTALQAELAELRSRFPETRALYREVCGLLFFRSGVTPTAANKLYSPVRKGSMGTPAEVLQALWQELRGRTRVTIDHPDLPDALKDIAAGAVQTIWQAADEAASAEVAALHADPGNQLGWSQSERSWIFSRKRLSERAPLHSARFEPLPLRSYDSSSHKTLQGCAGPSIATSGCRRALHPLLVVALAKFLEQGERMHDVGTRRRREFGLVRSDLSVV